MSKKRLLICLFVLTAGLLFAQNDSETQNRFSLGAGFSAFGPEIDFSYYNNHFTAEAELAVPAVMRNTDAMLGSFDLMPKLEAGYVFNNRADICSFVLGGAYISEYSFRDVNNLQLVGLYGKVFKNFFNGKMELSLKSYLPLFMGVCDADYFEPNFLFLSPSMLLLSAMVGGMATTISVKYCF